MLGASVRSFTMADLASALSTTMGTAREFAARLGIHFENVGGVEVLDLFNFECAWHRRYNPDLWGQGPDKAVAVIREIGVLYENTHRQALLQFLQEEGKALLPDVRRRKRSHQRDLYPERRNVDHRRSAEGYQRVLQRRREARAVATARRREASGEAD